jgi:arylsulfatase A-like enzyme
MNRTTLLLATAILCLGLTAGCRPSEPPDGSINVLLIVLDTTRADALPAYGGGQAHTPTLDRLGREGVVFANARTVSAWTLPSHASLFTGLYPSRHGAHWESPGLLASHQTLAELLAETHETGGFCENPHIIRTKGFAQGFARYEETWRRRESWDVPPITLELFQEWLGERDRSRPFFAFVNLMTPHLPYRPPERYQSRFVSEDLPEEQIQRMRDVEQQQAWAYTMGDLQLTDSDLETLRSLYAAEVAFADERVAQAIDAVRAEGELERTLVVVVGDHGENIGDHQLMEHQLCLYETLLRVPMIFHLPGVFEGGRVRKAAVQLVDVFPTVLDAAGVPRERWPALDGYSLLGADPPAERPTIAEYMRPGDTLRNMTRLNPSFDPSRYDRRLRSIQLGTLKLIVSDRDEVELYDLRADPGETRDLAGERPEEVERLRARLAAWTAEGSHLVETFTPEADPEALEAIRELGYVD